MTWLDEPLMALDTETTGTDPAEARIITACIGYSDRPGVWVPGQWWINPGVPIPAEASAVHGITDEDVADWASPAGALEGIATHLDGIVDAGTPIVGHNIAAYDLPLLDAEFRRHLGHGLPDGLLIIDTLLLWWALDRGTGGRRLTTIAAREDIIFPAHDATADALASLRLLHILAACVDLLPHVTPRALQGLQARWHAARQEQIHAKAAGEGRTITQDDTSWFTTHREELAHANR